MHGIFDSHAHYDDEKFDPDRDGVLGSLPGRGVAYVMNAASDKVIFVDDEVPVGAKVR